MIKTQFSSHKPTIAGAILAYNHKKPDDFYNSIVFDIFEGVYLQSMASKEKTNNTVSWVHVCTKKEFEDKL